MAACSRLAWNGSRPWPVEVVPSGKIATRWPASSASVIARTTRSASRFFSRSRYSVPAESTSRETSGQAFTSALETKRASGATAWITMMSSQDM